MTDKDPLILDFVNDRVLDGAELDEYYVGDLDDDEQPANWDDIDLEDMFDLPPVLPPIRLPEEAKLAVQARRSGLLADLRALADEVRTTTVHAAAVNPVLLRLAEEAELVERDGEDLAPGKDAGWLDDLADDSDALDAWEDTFAMVLDTTLEAADDSDPVVAPDLDLDGHGPALVLRLFLSWRDGVQITELADAIRRTRRPAWRKRPTGSGRSGSMPTVIPCGFCWASSKGLVPSASPTTWRGWSRWACKPSARSWRATACWSRCSRHRTR